jgi:flagellar basal body P-ring formation protein FlgA
MNRFLLPLALVLALASQSALAEALLRPNVVVDGDLVTLGDLFDNVGDKAGVAVARAPLPGKRVAVDADWLQRVATMNGVDWRPRSAFDQAIVERSGVTVGHEQIEGELLKALAAEGIPQHAEIELANRGAQMTVPVGVALDIGVRDLYYDSRYKRFTATIEMPANAPDATRMRVSGRVFATVDVPVLAHSLSRNEVVAAHDLVWARMRQDTLRRDIITDVDQIIGMEPRQSLRSGQMLSSSDLQKPVAVARGALVTMVLRYGAMSLSSQGRAIEQGSVGDVIRITNTRSNLTVEGKVEAPNMVSVQLNGVTALAN